MHLSRPFRALGPLLAGLSAGVILWAATAPPPTATLAPTAVGVR